MSICKCSYPPSGSQDYKSSASYNFYWFKQSLFFLCVKSLCNSLSVHYTVAFLLTEALFGWSYATQSYRAPFAHCSMLRQEKDRTHPWMNMVCARLTAFSLFISYSNDHWPTLEDAPLHLNLGQCSLSAHGCCIAAAFSHRPLQGEGARGAMPPPQRPKKNERMWKIAAFYFIK